MSAAAMYLTMDFNNDFKALPDVWKGCFDLSPLMLGPYGLFAGAA